MNQDKATEKLAGVKYAGRAHTPGPWHSVEPGNESVRDAKENPICYVESDYHTIDEQDANARLIAAAPDSNAANRHALMAFKSMRGLDAQNQSIADAAISVLDAAIRKATDGDE